MKKRVIVIGMIMLLSILFPMQKTTAEELPILIDDDVEEVMSKESNEKEIVDEEVEKTGLSTLRIEERVFDIEHTSRVVDITNTGYVYSSAELLSAVNDIEAEGTITIGQDIDMEEIVSIPANKIITIKSVDGNRYKITSLQTATSKRLILVSGKLILENIIIDGNNFHTGISVTGGELVLNAGAVVTKCYGVTTPGAGIWAQYGELKINGGEISYNVSTGAENLAYGGGIASEYSKITMTSGNIHHNTASTAGGIKLDRDSTFTMDGGDITNNNTTIGSGGGILAMRGGIITLNSGNISHNVAKTQGGGIFLGHGAYVVGESNFARFTMNGGTMAYNNAYAGGGVSSQWQGEIEINKGIITKNKALTGGGIYLVNPISDTSIKLALNGGEVSYNEATLSIGGGIRLDSGEVYPFTIHATIGKTDSTTIPKIHHNSAILESGGGIILQRKVELTLHKGEIYENIASNIGGGICVYNGSTLIMEDGTIHDNKARYGGGLGSVGSTTNVFRLEGGKILSNNATINGGGMYTDTPNTTISKMLFAENEAVNGGGIYVHETGVVDIRDNTILQKNIATNSGGGVFTEEYSYTDPADESRYQNISLDSSTVFTDNKAQVMCYPPKNRNAFSNLKYTQSSLENSVGRYLHPLNNLDINYLNYDTVASYDVVYDGNGGIGGFSDVDLEKDTIYPIRSDTEVGITREGYVFKEWNTSPLGDGISYFAEDSIQIVENIVLYAQWEKIEISNPELEDKKSKNEDTKPITSDMTDAVIWLLTMTFVGYINICLARKK